MRIKLIIEKSDRKDNDLLPINYQYELSAWVYKTIHFGNAEFADWLHEHGYMSEKKQFKLFTFSNLIINDLRLIKDRLQIKSNQVELIVSFYMDEVIEPFIIGIFQQQEFLLGDKISKVQFRVISIEKMQEPEYKEEMIFHAMSPIVTSKFDETINKNAVYLSPDDENYASFFMKNLLSKYVAILKSKSQQGNQLNFGHNNLKFELLNKPKSKLIKIKTDTPQTQVKGFLFDFRLSAPVELMKLGYNAGFGEKNSLGFGCVEKD